MRTKPLTLDVLNFTNAPRILVVRANFHKALVAALSLGAEQYLNACKVEYDYIDINGAMEIPAVVKLALDSKFYDAFVVLGCVIRGDTGHYDVVVNGTTQALMHLVAEYGALIGNGILTVETLEQAIERADPTQMNKGGEAAFAALRLVQIQDDIKALYAKQK